MPMIFGEAFEFIKSGRKVRRKYWRSKSVFMGDTKDLRFYLLYKIKKREPMPYTPTDNDLFADDWEISDDG